MRRTAGIALVLLGLAMAVWTFLRHAPSTGANEAPNEEATRSGYPVTVMVVAGLTLVAGLVVLKNKGV